MTMTHFQKIPCKTSQLFEQSAEKYKIVCFVLLTFVYFYEWNMEKHLIY